MTSLRRRYFKPLRLFLCFSCFAWLIQAGEQKKFPSLTQGEMQHIESIKKELKFAQWRYRDQNGRNILLPSIEIAALLPADIKCDQENIEGTIPTYRVQCSRKVTDGTRETVVFNVWLCPSVDQAREGILRRFLTVSAPMSYLKELWDKQKVTYGDKSFGFGCWITGNIIFDLTDGKEHEEWARKIFSTIDDMLNAEPTNLSGTAADIGINAIETGAESWTFTIPKSESGRQIVISYENAAAELLDHNVLKISRLRSGLEAAFQINLIESGEPLRSFRGMTVRERDD